MKTKHLSHRITSIILSILMLSSMLVLPQSAAVSVQASAKTLTEETSGVPIAEVPDGYIGIYTMEDLETIRNNTAGKYILMNNIDLSKTAPSGEYNNGNGWIPISDFAGIINGNGYIISNLNIFGDVQCAGFVGTNYGQLYNLHFENVNVSINTESSEMYYGTVAGINFDSKSSIYRCSVSGDITISTTGTAYIGGITGYNAYSFNSTSSSRILECYNKSSINITSGSNAIYAGGIAGYQGPKSGYGNYNYKSLYDCYNCGTLFCSGYNKKVGGILGWLAAGSISNCYALNGNILPSYNRSRNDYISSCYYPNNYTSYYYSNGNYCVLGTPLTAPLMQQSASYLNFDFNYTWEMFNGRPQLKNNPEFIPIDVTIKQLPSKIIYNAGEKFIIDGTLEVTCKDGTVGTVHITPNMVGGCTKSSEIQNVTITYRDCSVTTSVPVEINDDIPEGYTPIYNIAQLYAIRSTPSGKYILMNDIDMSATAQGGEWDGGNGWTPIPKFSGTLDGNGFILSSMNFYGSIENAGFININTGTLTDLHFDDVDVDISSGSLFGTISCINYSNINKVIRCSVSGNINIRTNKNVIVGGVIGKCGMDENKIGSDLSECYNKAVINVSGATDYVYIGGLVGDQYTANSYIKNCYFSGDISYSKGSTSCRAYCGGIIGYLGYGSVLKCINFVNGRISGLDKTVKDCYCLDGSTFGFNGTTLSNVLITQSGSFRNFDFIDIWEKFDVHPQLKNNPEFKPTSLRFKESPKKISFNSGDAYSVDGTIEAIYNDSTIVELPIVEEMASGYDMTKIGVQTVTLKYRGQTLTYPINVLEVFSKNIELDKKDETIVKGNNLQLTATISPDNTTNKTITWTTTNDKIATVDENGKVSAIAPGKATITAATSNGKKATCAVTVIIPAENITLDKNYAPINKGETLTLTATTTPAESTDKLTWASSDESVATVDNTGKITAKGAGTANITATADSGVFASCFVEVSVPVKALTLSSQSLDMIAGGNEVLTLTVDPSDTTDGIEWSVSDDAVSLQVSDDKKTATVYANYAGSADITVVSDSGVETVCSVSIVRNADSISFSEYYKTLEKGDEYTIIPILAPQDCTDKITWHSDNTRAVTVDNNGKITAVGKGTANVSAQITNGLTATIAVTVTVSPTELKLDRSTVDIIGNGSVQVNASVEPDDADKSITWSSSDNGIAYVDSYGNIYGVSSGKAVVTATTQNGLTANCTVNVQFIDISKANIKLSYSEVQYDGYDKTPDVTVTLDGKELQKDTDYTVIYSNNNNVGTATVTLIGIGDYEGKASKTFTITQPPKINISTCTATLNQTVFYYDGNEKKPGVTVKNGSTRLYEGSDYTLSYSNNRNIGTGKVTMNGIGGYTGTKELTFSIEEAPKTDISGCKIALTPTSYTYNGTAREPRVTVKDGYTTLYEGTDYTVSYSNNVNVGTAVVTVRGIGNYTGSKQATFTIDDVARKNIANCTVTLSKTSYVYDGTAKRPTVTVKDSGKTLSYGQDYTIEYTNNLRVGTATVTVTGVGNYTGAKNVSFTINSAPKTDIVNCTITLSQSVYTYDGTAKRPSVTVKRGAATLIVNTDYTVSYSNNTNVGTAKVTVTGKGNYSGTKSATFIIKSPTPVKTPFTWGSDNWNFINADYNGDFSSDTYRSQINKKYANALKENLTNSEYQVIFIGSDYSKAWLDDKFAGSCYGMSSTTLLAKQGFLPYASYKAGATKLHDLDKPTSNMNVSSLITYYQMLQVKSVTQQQYRTVPKRSHQENITEIISLLDKNDTVLLGFSKTNWGGHAILAYDYEYGNWTKGGVSYGGRIKICDPNSSNKNDDNYYIYFNTRTYAWAIPAYTGITSAKGAVFNYINANINDINQGGYLSGNTSNRSDGFIARIDAFAISENRSVAKVQIGENGNYFTMNTAPGDIEEDYSYILGNESEGTIGYNLRDGDSAYQVTQSEPDEIELAMTYENCSMIGGSKAGESVVFDKSGFVEVKGQSAEYSMAITMNDKHPTDWFNVSVKGQGADSATLRQVDDGWVVTSDSLKNVAVSVNNKYDMAYTSFTTEYPEALIYEIDEDTIGIAVDKDNNGTYETTLNTKTSKSNPDDVKPGETESIGNLGDIDNDGEITANDALTILRASVGLSELTPDQTKLADIDGDGQITANDALSVLRYSVGLVDEDSPIGKPIAA